jgi:hypothetical protein
MAYVFDVASPRDLTPDSKLVARFREPHVALAMKGLQPGCTLDEED